MSTATDVRDVPGGAGAAGRTPRAIAAVRRLSDALLTWPKLLAAFYIVLGAYFISRGAYMGDAISRVEIARGVVEGFDPGGVHIFGFTPHAAAIGFIWGPIVSGLEIPLVMIGRVWPWLVRDSGAGVIVSSLFMAWGARTFNQILVEHGLRTRWVALLTVGFALNPFIVFYACNGMSEAPYIALLLACLRRLASWQRDGRTSDLALAGIFLGLDYWVRYEPLVAAVTATVFIVVLTLQEWHPTRTERLRHTTVNALVFLMPVAFCVLVFSAISWWITGFILEQAQSIYGASTQNGLAVEAVNSRVDMLSKQVLELLPMLPLAAILAGIIQYQRRATLFPVICWVMVGPFLFDMYDMSNSKLLDLERYMILGIPITMLFLASLARWRRIGMVIAVLATAAMWVGAFLFTGQPAMAPQEYQFHQALIGASPGKHVDFAMSAPRTIAQWLDAKDLPPGSILMDTLMSVGVFLESDHPDRFVLPAYQGFDSYLDAPYEHHVRYLVTVDPGGGGALNLINRFYPGLYEGCLKNTELVFDLHEVGGDVSEWRVFKVTGPISPSHLVYNTDSCRIP